MKGLDIKLQFSRKKRPRPLIFHAKPNGFTQKVKM